jgi:hypothetical protein
MRIIQVPRVAFFWDAQHLGRGRQEKMLDGLVVALIEKVSGFRIRALSLSLKNGGSTFLIAQV